MSSIPRRPKLLFLISNDFGELFMANYFCMGQPFDVHMAMPERLFTVNRGSSPYPMSQFSSIDDVLHVVDSIHPDVVLLFSGYLFVHNGIFSMEAFKELIRGLEKRPCAVATTEIWQTDWSERDLRSTLGYNRNDPRQRTVVEHFSTLYPLLKPFPQLYAMNVEHIVRNAHITFFNEQMIRSSNTLSADGNGSWLFILASEDHQLQCERFGRERFYELLMARLRDAVRSGATAILNAPPACVDRLLNVYGQEPGIVFLPTCDHIRFMELLLAAAYVFYWNFTTSSATARVLNQLPLFYFDQGYMMRLFPSLLERRKVHHPYYDFLLETLLPIEAPLDGEQLRSQIPAYLERHSLPYIKEFSLALSPTQVIDRLVGR